MDVAVDMFWFKNEELQTERDFIQSANNTITEKLKINGIKRLY